MAKRRTRSSKKKITKKQNKIVSKFYEVSKQIKSDLREIRQVTTHPGLKGFLIGEVVRDFLRKHLPSHLEVARGIIHDSTGKMSKELDIIIFDVHQTPIFYQLADVRIIPVETVYAVIEIKAFLDSRELNNVLKHMKVIRGLKKRAYVNTSGKKIEAPLYGKIGHEIWPINYFVFSEDSISLAKLKDMLERAHVRQKLPLHKRIDSVCVLKKGVIVNKQLRIKDSYSAIPGGNTHLDVWSTNHGLLTFFGLLMNLLAHAHMPVTVKFTDYLPSK